MVKFLRRPHVSGNSFLGGSCARKWPGNELPGCTKEPVMSALEKSQSLQWRQSPKTMDRGILGRGRNSYPSRLNLGVSMVNVEDSDENSDEDKEENEAYDPEEDKQSNSKKRKAVRYKLDSDKEKRIRCMVTDMVTELDVETPNELSATRKVLLDAVDKRIKELKELNSNEYKCPVCKCASREGVVFVVINKCRHVICAVCQCRLFADMFSRFSRFARCPVCRAQYREVTDLSIGNFKKVTELDVKNKIRCIFNDDAAGIGSQTTSA